MGAAAPLQSSLSSPKIVCPPAPAIQLVLTNPTKTTASTRRGREGGREAASTDLTHKAPRVSDPFLLCLLHRGSCCPNSISSSTWALLLCSVPSEEADRPFCWKMNANRFQIPINRKSSIRVKFSSPQRCCYFLPGSPHSPFRGL